MMPDINTIELSDYDAKKIATKLFRKREDYLYLVDAWQTGLITRQEWNSNNHNLTQ